MPSANARQQQATPRTSDPCGDARRSDPACGKSNRAQFQSRTRRRRRAAKMLILLAGATGLEPATFGVTGRRSNQLSYAPTHLAREYARAREIRDPPGQVKVAAGRPLQARRRRAPRRQNARFSTEIVPVARAEVSERARNPAFSQLSTQ